MPRTILALLILLCHPFPAPQTKKPALSSSAALPTSFEHDARLDTPITVPPRVYKGGSLFTIVKRRADVDILTNTDSEEFRTALVVVGCKDISTRALLDGFAALFSSRYTAVNMKNSPVASDSRSLRVAVPKKGYLMYSSLSTYEGTWGGTEFYQKQRYAFGDVFIAALNALPKEEQDRILAPGGVDYNSLPPALKQAVKDMRVALDNEDRAEGLDGVAPLPVDKIGTGTLSFDRDNKYGFYEYHADMMIPGHSSVTWMFSEYNAWKKKQEGTADDGTVPMYDTLRSQIPQKQARKLPVLQRKVSVHLPRATISEVLTDLHGRYDLPFVTEDPRFFKERTDVEITDLPLADALDKVIALYRKSKLEWEYRKYGFIVVREVRNKRSKDESGRRVTK